jgi:S-DNA-T family DNA segregation ATPase FtsK/SpoIIIE
MPCIVFVFADHTIWSEAAGLDGLMRLLLADGPALGVYSLFLAETRNHLPPECDALVELTKARPRLEQIGASRATAAFTPDSIDVDTAEQFARALAPLRLAEISGADPLPTVVPMLEVFNIRRVEDLEVARRWRESMPFDSLAADIGILPDGQRCALDIHMREHGPHGLIAGATRSGKTDLIQMIVASLAARFHPHELAFVIFDYNGSGLASMFRDLPHQIGLITTLSDDLSARVLAALRAAMQRRHSLLAAAGVATLDEYQRYRRRDPAAPPLPHLVVVADEVAEVASRRPHMIRDLIEIVEMHKHLGVHLLLATNQPSGSIFDQVNAASHYRLCLRVERPEDSQQVLGFPDAVTLRQPGHTYLQVGRNDVFDVFQAGWGGALYTPELGMRSLLVTEVDLDGSRARSNGKARQDGKTQMQALVEHIDAVAKQQRIGRLVGGAWLPSVERTVSLDELRRGQNGGWDGARWRPAARRLAPPIGLVDNAGRHARETLHVDLADRGHMLICGQPNAGKTTLLQTLITALALDHTPEEVRFTLLDFDNRGLAIFEPLPHVDSVISLDEPERLGTLARVLRDEVELRQRPQQQRGPAQSATALPPRIIVIDNWPRLYRKLPREMMKLIQRAAHVGGPLGMLFVITAHARTDVATALLPYLRLEIDLAAIPPDDHDVEVSEVGELLPMLDTRWRGYVAEASPVEFRPALAVAGETEADRHNTLKSLVRAMSTAWRSIPRQ